MKLLVKARRRHVSGWMLIAAGICLLWLWWNFRETFAGSVPLYFIDLDGNDVPFIAGVICLVAGALQTRGGWSARILGVPLRYVVGLLLVAAAASTARPMDVTSRADTWVAFHRLRPALEAISLEVPRGVTSMECELLRGDAREGPSDPICSHILETRVTQRTPTEDSLYAAMVDAQGRGFYDIEMRPTHVAVVRITASPGIRQGFLKLHQPQMSALPQQLFLHPIADIYPLEDGWFHFVTR